MRAHRGDAADLRVRSRAERGAGWPLPARIRRGRGSASGRTRRTDLACVRGGPPGAGRSHHHVRQLPDTSSSLTAAAPVPTPPARSSPSAFCEHHRLRCPVRPRPRRRVRYDASRSSALRSGLHATPSSAAAWPLGAPAPAATCNPTPAPSPVPSRSSSVRRASWSERALRDLRALDDLFGRDTARARRHVGLRRQPPRCRLGLVTVGRHRVHSRPGLGPGGRPQRARRRPPRSAGCATGDLRALLGQVFGSLGSCRSSGASLPQPRPQGARRRGTLATGILFLISRDDAFTTHDRAPRRCGRSSSILLALGPRAPGHWDDCVRLRDRGRAYGPGFVVSWQCFFGLGFRAGRGRVRALVTEGSSASSGRAQSGSAHHAHRDTAQPVGIPALLHLPSGPFAVLVGGSVGCARPCRFGERCDRDTDRQLGSANGNVGTCGARICRRPSALHTSVGIMAHNEEANLERLASDSERSAAQRRRLRCGRREWMHRRHGRHRQQLRGSDAPVA